VALKTKVIKAIHTGMVVSNLDRSIEFYRDGLGLTVSEKLRHEGQPVADLIGAKVSAVEIAFVSLPNWEIELLQYHGSDVRKTSNLHPSDVGCMHLSIEVNSVETALARIAEAGYAPTGIVMSPQKGPRKGGKLVYTQDPDGIVIELVEMPHCAT
jgi:lactoylglutathione lyase